MRHRRAAAEAGGEPRSCQEGFEGTMLSSVEIPETSRRSLTALAKNASLDSLRDTLPYFRPKRRAFTPSTRAVHPGGRKIMFDVAVSELTSPRWDLHDEVERAFVSAESRGVHQCRTEAAWRGASQARKSDETVLPVR